MKRYIKANTDKELAKTSSSLEILAKLANDDDSYVRECAAQNPNTPPEILAKLAKDKDWRVRKEIARNPNTPPEILANLAKDKDRDVRRYAAKNPNTPRTNKKSKKSHDNYHNYSDYDEALWQAFLDDFMSKYPNTEIDGDARGDWGYVDLYPEGDDSYEYYHFDESDIRSVTKQLYESGALIDEDAISEIYEAGMWKDVEYDDYYDDDEY